MDTLLSHEAMREESSFSVGLDAFIALRLEKIKFLGSDRGLDFFAF